MPLPMVALPCGSRSIKSTRLPASTRPAARLTLVVVLPTPPFWLATARMRGITEFLPKGTCPLGNLRRRKVMRTDAGIQAGLRKWLCGRLAPRCLFVLCDQHQVPCALDAGDRERQHLLYYAAWRQFVDFLIRMQSFHRRERPAGREQMPGDAHELVHVGKGARNDYVESVLRLPSLDALAAYLCVIQLQFNHGLIQKRGLLVIAVEQGHMRVRLGERERNAGQSGAAAHIEHALGVQMRRHGEAVEQVMAHHFLRLAYRGEVVYPVPLFDQCNVIEQTLLDVALQRQSKRNDSALQLIGRTHAAGRCSRVSSERPSLCSVSPPLD